VQLRKSKYKDGGASAEEDEVISSVLLSRHSCEITEEIQEEYQWEQLSLDRRCTRNIASKRI
jgi:hypothetical protein